MSKRKPRVYIIPGLGETTRFKNYKEVKELFKNAEFSIIPVKICWGTDSTMDDFIQEARLQVRGCSSEDYIFGFSFGAYIASVLSADIHPKGFLFCTISPYFKENLKDIPVDSKEYFGKKMMNSLKKYSFPNVSKSKAWFLVGEEDWPLALERTKMSYTKWKGFKDLIFVKKAGHSLVHPNYITALEKVVKEIKGMRNNKSE